MAAAFLQLSCVNLAQGELFARIDSNQDGELSRSELQAELSSGDWAPHNRVVQRDFTEI